jgi:hypothetical protein
MSLSFPGLICAVPLWRRDFTLVDLNEQQKLRRCLFSDGGLSSNFPIHLFDRLLPNLPTFAIALDRYDQKRDRGNSRVWLPQTAGSGINIPLQPIDGFLGFLMRLIDSAKDWQDNLRSTLPGYRERIAHIGLTDDEGGINLTMDQSVIASVSGYGAAAGAKLCEDFDLDAHRWRRYLVAMAASERTFDEMAFAYAPPAGAQEGFKQFLDRYAGEPGTYKQTAKITGRLLEHAEALARLGQAWHENSIIEEGNIPRPQANLHIAPRF